MNDYGQTYGPKNKQSKGESNILMSVGAFKYYVGYMIFIIPN